MMHTHSLESGSKRAFMSSRQPFSFLVVIWCTSVPSISGLLENCSRFSWEYAVAQVWLCIPVVLTHSCESGSQPALCSISIAISCWPFPLLFSSLTCFSSILKTIVHCMALSDLCILLPVYIFSDGWPVSVMVGAIASCNMISYTYHFSAICNLFSAWEWARTYNQILSY